MPQQPKVVQETNPRSPYFGLQVNVDPTSPDFGMPVTQAQPVSPAAVKAPLNVDLSKQPTQADIDAQINRLYAASQGPQQPTMGSILSDAWGHVSRLGAPTVHAVAGIPGALKDMYQVGKDMVIGNNSPEAIAFGRQVVMPTSDYMQKRREQALADASDPQFNLAQRGLAYGAAGIYGLSSLPLINAIVSPVVTGTEKATRAAIKGDLPAAEEGTGDVISAFAAAKAGEMAGTIGKGVRTGLNKAVLWPGDTLQKFPKAPGIMSAENAVPYGADSVFNKRPFSGIGIDKTVGDMLGVQPVETASRRLTDATRARVAAATGVVDIKSVLDAGERAAAEEFHANSPSSQTMNIQDEISKAKAEAQSSYDQTLNGRTFMTPDEALKAKIAEQGHAKRGAYNPDPTANASPVKNAFARGAAAEIRRQLIEIDPALADLFDKQQGMLGAAKGLSKGDKGVVGPIRVAEGAAIATGVANHIPAWWAAGAGAAGLMSPTFSTALQTAIRQGERFAGSTPGVYSSYLGAARSSKVDPNKVGADALKQIEALRRAIKDGER